SSLNPPWPEARPANAATQSCNGGAAMPSGVTSRVYAQAVRYREAAAVAARQAVTTFRWDLRDLATAAATDGIVECLSGQHRTRNQNAEPRTRNPEPENWWTLRQRVLTRTLSARDRDGRIRNGRRTAEARRTVARCRCSTRCHSFHSGKQSEARTAWH